MAADGTVCNKIFEVGVFTNNWPHMNRKGGDADNFADSAKIAPWAKDAVAAVSAAGIMNGVGNNNFDPTAVYSCEQSALTLLRTYKLLTK